MRAPGAYIPDMINYAYDVDTYSMWADVLIYDKVFVDINRKCLVGYASRRDGINYTHSLEDIQNEYGSKIVLQVEVPEVLSAAMGNYCFLFKAMSKEEIMDITRFIIRRNGSGNWL